MATGQILPTQGAVVFGTGAQEALNSTIGQLQQQQQLQAKQRVAQAQQLADSWRKNMLSASNGRLWSDQLGQIEQQHVLAGEQLMQSGIDPYSSSDPRAIRYRQERMQVENMRNYRAGVEKEFNAINNVIRQDPNKWRQDDLNKLNEFISGGNFQELYNQNTSLPQVRQRFDVNSVVKGSAIPFRRNVVANGVETTEEGVDKEATRNTILSRLRDPNNPAANEYLSSITGGFTPEQLNQAPDTLEAARSLTDGFYQSNPQFREGLAQQGITSMSDPRYAQFADDFAANLVDSKKRFNDEIDRLITSASGGQRVVSSSRPNYTQENQERARAKYQMEVVRFNERNIKKSRSSSSDDDESYTPSDKQYIAYGNDSKVGKAPMYGYTNFNAKNVNFVGNNMVDLETGQVVPSKAVQNGDVIALGYVPSGTNNRTLAQESFAINNPQNVSWRKMALVTADEKIGSRTLQRQYMVPAENLPGNMAKPALYNQFMRSTFTPPTSSSRSTSSGATNSQSQTKRKITW